MRVSAGVREDKDPTDSLPARATCISSCRSRCAQIRPASVAVYWLRLVKTNEPDAEAEDEEEAAAPVVEVLVVVVVEEGDEGEEE